MVLHKERKKMCHQIVRPMGREMYKDIQDRGEGGGGKVCSKYVESQG